MKVIKPIQIDDSNLLSSTIPEPDASVGETEWTAGTYTLGTRRIKSSTHLIYEVVADPSTTDDPEVGVEATPQTWIVVEPTNRYSMFDNVNSTTSDGDNIVVELQTGQVGTGMAGFNITASTINITCVSASDGEVYNVDIEMIDNSNVIDWLTYFTEGFVIRDQFILTDIPVYGDLTTTVTFGGTDVSVGTLITGQVIDLGVAQYGTSWQGLNFSKKERDQFGNVVLTQGRTADRLDYDVIAERGRFGSLKQELKRLDGLPTVWIGNPDNINDGTATFGYYVDNQINISTPVTLDLTITVESFV